MKTFPITLEDNIHFKIKKAALEQHITMHEYIIQAITEKLTKVKEGK